MVERALSITQGFYYSSFMYAFNPQFAIACGLAALCIFFPAPVDGGAPHLAPLPIEGPAPLLFVRFAAPPGMNVTFYPGRAAGQDLPVPVTAGLRPGYIYRVKLSSIPDRPELFLYPTLEVRGTLQLPKVVRGADHPVPIVFTPEDIERALRGALITKVVLLEDPEQALATATRADRPLEMEIAPGRDPLTEAQSHGRPLLIVRLGERVVSEQELTGRAIPGTVLLPGMKSLPPPALPPWIPWAFLPMIDPIAGPRPPTEECVHDGGDGGSPAGFDRNGEVQGLDPADAVAAYSDSRGQRRLAVSNRVCLCVPRFIVFRGETSLTGYAAIVGLGADKKVQGRAQLQARLPSLETKQTELTQQFKQTENLRGTQQTRAGPALVGQIHGVNVIGNVREIRDVTSSCQDLPQTPDRPLHLYKSADKQSAQVGDVVTFHLKYANLGGQPIANVAVSDSLTGRLEYIPGSAHSSRDAVFLMQENRAGSLTLHWEIAGPLLPGTSGVVRFQARIR